MDIVREVVVDILLHQLPQEPVERPAPQVLLAYVIELILSPVDIVVRVKRNTVMRVVLDGLVHLLIPPIPPHLVLHIQHSLLRAEHMDIRVNLKYVITLVVGQEHLPSPHLLPLPHEHDITRKLIHVVPTDIRVRVKRVNQMVLSVDRIHSPVLLPIQHGICMLPQLLRAEPTVPWEKHKRVRRVDGVVLLLIHPHLHIQHE